MMNTLSDTLYMVLEQVEGSNWILTTYKTPGLATHQVRASIQHLLVHSKHCEVSFGEPQKNIIVVQEGSFQFCSRGKYEKLPEEE